MMMANKRGNSRNQNRHLTWRREWRRLLENDVAVRGKRQPAGVTSDRDISSSVIFVAKSVTS